MLFVFTNAVITSEKIPSTAYIHVHDMYVAAFLHMNVAKPPTVLLLVDKVNTFLVHINL